MCVMQADAGAARPPELPRGQQAQREAPSAAARPAAFDSTGAEAQAPPAGQDGAALSPDQGQTPPTLSDLARTIDAAGKLNRRLEDA